MDCEQKFRAHGCKYKHIFEHQQLLLVKVCLFTCPAPAGEEIKRVFLVSAGFKVEYFGT